jgi:hypothetical protein
VVAPLSLVAVKQTIFASEAELICESCIAGLSVSAAADQLRGAAASAMSTPIGNKQQKQAKSTGKDCTRSDTFSQQHSTFQILLQSRSSSLQCYPDKISMTSKDMKSLNVKAGRLAFPAESWENISFTTFMR